MTEAEFKTLLDKLTFMKAEEKVGAMMIFLSLDDQKKADLCSFFEEQVKAHEILVEEYRAKIRAADQILKADVDQARQSE